MFSLPCCLVADSRMRSNLFYLNWNVHLNLTFLPPSCTGDGCNDYKRCWSKQAGSIMDQSRTEGTHVFKTPCPLIVMLSQKGCFLSCAQFLRFEGLLLRTTIVLELTLYTTPYFTIFFQSNLVLGSIVHQL